MPRGRYKIYTEEEAYQRKLASGRRAGAKWRAKTDRSLYHKNYDTQRSPESVLLRAAKDRARKHGIPHTITLEDIKIPPCCPICKKAMAAMPGSKGGGATSPSLDKIIPSKGYVTGNVAVICKKCNSMKGDASPELLRAMASYIDLYTY